jgi:CTP:molybdopterin cytidylyltransferase MocA
MLAVALETMPPKAVILAAGRGERLRPLLECLLALLVAAGAREVAIKFFHCHGCFLDIGSPERYRKVQADAARLLVRLLALPAGQGGLSGGSTARGRRLGGVYAAG